MAYPNPTTYTLPFMDKIRVSSRRRFILVRDANRGAGPDLPGQPVSQALGLEPRASVFIVRRSETLATLEREYRRSTDYIIDQAQGTITFHFNGKKEVQSV
jgi:hypothetical protein